MTDTDPARQWSGTAPPPRRVDPGLYVVATPIGNLRDMTLRALDVLAAADLVLAEDTRVSARLLTAYGLRVKLERCDDHAAVRAIPGVLARLAAGEVVALVSDAGTPLVSDPGYAVVKAVIEAGLPVFPLPGASSLLAALTGAGLPSDRVLFAGFLPAKSGGRRTALEGLKAPGQTVVVFESGPRLAVSLADMAEVLGPREAVVARELTKLHETWVRGPLDQVAVDPRCQSPKGEMVVVIGPADEVAPDEATLDQALTAELADRSVSEAAARVAASLGLPRKQVYRRALELSGQ
ncbi:MULTISPECIES: 16S rRNA (cytidine(1402)-2'-O)-methyltransferase [unclassified Brevundimonas]|jgi:16S rRNA (cytidine1402-2'-O)-methyltransferase|uniref:16S rRNA (cytidine(1402)-2'-O)-methyltransferase n=1 Tax=unclassified Brevundimonas TaxID=2622653 RepID=UPI000C52E458|nr:MULTISPECIES: 16S rRNA (cytidine(1402)-2'-O)-methyltransferase [unclassified Brevundimonas]MAL89401.1 16S rRNA (cytidine(1402)-2'-O)-methyltransferase [Brevundimonas sp.]HAV50781.1 16S rRNA (cytidine(1402)-2'-O)-methyltransferase [Brevundimonas sp.]|tara:strand:+ start:7403 stop:8284 length:882 start_codon:yes stop_codon:yes gene_type:complete